MFYCCNEGQIIGAGPKREVLTDELLSEAFHTNVKVHWEDGRPWLSIQKSGRTESIRDIII